MKDRQNDYIKNKMYVCEVNCEFDDYNSENKKIQCNCQIKNKFPLFSEIIINKDKFLKNFISIDNIMNLNLMKCYEILFTKEGLISNIANYIMLSMILILLICVIIFIIKGYKSFISLIDIIIFKRKTKKKFIKIKKNDKSK